MCQTILSAPLFVEWEVTNACNLRCGYCFASSGPKAAGELTTVDAKHVLDNLDNSRVFKVTFTGGEPFCRKDFSEIIDHAAQKSLSLQILTNGTLVSKEAMNILASATHKTSIQVSIEGPTSLHDKLVGVDGAYLKAIETIRELLARGANVSVCTTLTSLNWHCVEHTVDLCLRLRVTRWRLITMIPWGRAAGRNFEPSLDQYRRAYRALKQKRCDTEGRLAMEVRYPNGLPYGIETYDPTANEAQWVGCCGAITYCVISPNGDVIPCVLLRGKRFVAGRAHITDIAAIWKKSPMQYLRALHGKASGRCLKCRYLRICRGGCKALSSEATCDPTSPDPRCGYPGDCSYTLSDFYNA